MKTKQKFNLFNPGDKIGRKGVTGVNQVQLLINFVDHTRDVYVFDLPWIHNLTKHNSYNFQVVEELFEKIN